MNDDTIKYYKFSPAILDVETNRVKTSEKWFRGRGLQVEIAVGRGRERRGTPLEPFVKKRLLCRLNKSLLSGFLPILCFHSRFPLVSRDWKRISQPCCYFQKAVICFIFILSNHILPPDTSPKWRRGRKKRKLKRVISFLTVHFFVSTAGQEAEIHLCVHVQFYSLRNKVDVQSLGDCQHWICFRLSCRVG